MVRGEHSLRLCLRAFGLDIALALDGEDQRKHLSANLPPGFHERGDERGDDAIFHVRPCGTSASERLEAADLALSEAELWVAEHARGFIFIHAGCVAVDGQAIVLPGRTLAGKSTLTAALLRAGATYYSDEYALLDAAGRVWPYARPLAIRSDPAQRGRRTAIDRFTTLVANRPARVRLVAALQFSADQGWNVQSATPGRAVLAMFDNTVPARSRPAEVLTALTAAARGAVFLHGTRGDADDAAKRLLERLKPGDGQVASLS